MFSVVKNNVVNVYAGKEESIDLKFEGWLNDLNENMVYVTSSTSDHIARINMIHSTATIIVEHDCPDADSGIFHITERRLAIEFIESLFIIFSKV